MTTKPADSADVESQIISAPGIKDALARLPAQTIIDERGLAAAIKYSPKTIRRMVGRGELPVPVPFAGRHVWFAGRILSFLERKMEKAETAGERRVAAIEK